MGRRKTAQQTQSTRETLWQMYMKLLEIIFSLNARPVITGIVLNSLGDYLHVTSLK